MIKWVNKIGRNKAKWKLNIKMLEERICFTIWAITRFSYCSTAESRSRQSNITSYGHRRSWTEGIFYQMYFRNLNEVVVRNYSIFSQSPQETWVYLILFITLINSHGLTERGLLLFFFSISQHTILPRR